jgi:hypothetical protein
MQSHGLPSLRGEVGEHDAEHALMANDHYVSRFQIRHWVPAGHQKVCVYLCDADRIEWMSPKSLFALEGLNERDVELRLDQLIESPLGQHQVELFEPPVGTSIEPRHWRATRAVWLLAILQGPRTFTALGIGGGTPIGEYMRWPIDKLDALIVAAQREHQLTLVQDPQGRLLLPNLGTFAVPVADPGCVSGMSWAQACPIGPGRAVVISTKTATLAASDLGLLAPHKTLPIASFGSGNHVSRLVIPPCHLQPGKDQADVEAWVRSCRPEAAKSWQGYQEMRRTKLHALREAGIPLERVPRGPERWRVVGAPTA